MIEFLVTHREAVPPRGGLRSEFRWQERCPIPTLRQQPRRSTGLYDDAATIRLWLGHAGVSSLSARPMQRIEKTRKKRETLASASPQRRPVDLFCLPPRAIDIPPEGGHSE